MELPTNYNRLTPAQRKSVREQYIVEQAGLCMFCKAPLSDKPSPLVSGKFINWKLFPPNFLAHPVHLQHCHKTEMTEGAVHAYCNAVLWQYHGR